MQTRNFLLSKPFLFLAIVIVNVMNRCAIQHTPPETAVTNMLPLVSVSRRVICIICQHVPEVHDVEDRGRTLRTNDQTTTLLGALVDGLDDVDQLLLVLQNPVQLVVVTGSEITHHMFIAIKVHDRHWIVELVHGTKVGDLIEIAEVNDGEI